MSSPLFDTLRSTTRSGGTNKEEAGEAPPPPPLPSRPSSLGRAGPHPLANGKEGNPTQKGIGVPNSSSAQVDTRRQTKKGDKRRERKTGTRKDRNGKEGRQRSGGLSQPQQDCLAPPLPAQPWKEVGGKGGRNRVPHNAPAVAPEGRPRKGVATEVYAESGGRDSPPSRQPVTSRANRGDCQGRFSNRDRVSKDAESNHKKHTRLNMHTRPCPTQEIMDRLLHGLPLAATRRNFLSVASGMSPSTKPWSALLACIRQIR